MSKWTINFTTNGAADFAYWKGIDLNKVERIRALLHAIEVDPFSGIGKPERLRHHKNPALYSRRIDQQHRLVYSVSGSTVTVVACRFHYGDK
ncbi:Txe/YoeB family addiction module toxin [Aeromonas salmonicida subsp. achromogenes]|uniref:Txe/YoeB family addiction module toxin n=1 Tax=Aeromonas TaxID=642 RepID=UPI00036E97BF|nr:Txe/YoeB family addiction module toxin [Aeromonas salmonicida]TMX13971.1 Txe/YoeB family addiction module toxin [Aeromonas salmonicida subsp. achromogenes]TMX17658.1 Txe/YoeB family addiction module toxin [Aeromonas salmonicida subsp. achromogenes]TMX18287.1 Txe/YoeB family addiction module toxin [Aeromonas salmonicida subsp. achromogenes]TMX21219.1 Txe/YoeB family addiction module toxin [Aeromonas salmonicida subsp. achromogenes]